MILEVVSITETETVEEDSGILRDGEGAIITMTVFDKELATCEAGKICSRVEINPALAHFDPSLRKIWSGHPKLGPSSATIVWSVGDQTCQTPKDAAD